MVHMVLHATPYFKHGTHLLVFGWKAPKISTVSIILPLTLASRLLHIQLKAYFKMLLRNPTVHWLYWFCIFRLIEIAMGPRRSQSSAVSTAMLTRQTGCAVSLVQHRQLYVQAWVNLWR